MGVANEPSHDVFQPAASPVSKSDRAALAGLPSQVVYFNGSTSRIPIVITNQWPDNEYNVAFAWEVNFYANQVASSTQVLAAQMTDAGNYRGWMFWIDAATQNLMFTIRHNTTPKQAWISGGTTLVKDTWYKAKCVSTGTGTAAGLQIWLNDVLETPTTQSDTLGANTIVDVTTHLSFGSRNGTSLFFDGRMHTAKGWSAGSQIAQWPLQALDGNGDYEDTIASYEGRDDNTTLGAY